MKLTHFLQNLRTLFFIMIIQKHEIMQIIYQFCF